jgi:prepilin-type processing-associated H-X9-DG protein
LLVVVAIIAILSALLLPVISNARGMARAAVCQSNLKQFGVAMHLYRNMWSCFPAHEWKLDSTPGDGHNDEKDRVRWFRQLDQMLDLGQNVQTCPSTPDWVCGRNNSYGYNYKYLGSSRRHSDGGLERFPVKEVADPAHTIACGDSAGTGTEGPYEPVPFEQGSSGLAYNARKNRIGNQGYILDPTYIPKRSQGCVGGETYADRMSPSLIAFRHNGKANFCMADGHVEALGSDEVYADNSWWNGYGSEDPRDDHVPGKIVGLPKEQPDPKTTAAASFASIATGGLGN